MHTFAWPFHVTRRFIQSMFLLDDAIRTEKKEKQFSHDKKCKKYLAAAQQAAKTPRKMLEFIWPRHYIIKTTGRKCIAILEVQKGQNLNRWTTCGFACSTK